MTITERLKYASDALTNATVVKGLIDRCMKQPHFTDMSLRTPNCTPAPGTVGFSMQLRITSCDDAKHFTDPLVARRVHLRLLELANHMQKIWELESAGLAKDLEIEADLLLQKLKTK